MIKIFFTFVLLAFQYDVSHSTTSKISSHHLRTFSFIGLGANTHFGGCDFLNMGKKLNLIGLKFGKLTVISLHNKTDSNSATYWLCKCDCGNNRVAFGSGLVRGQIRSCGCLNPELHTKHGETGTRLHRIWCGMKSRCSLLKGRDKKNYLDRNIRICQEWMDYMCFRKWALENGYSEDLTIDRIDNDGNYCPENCRWATMAEQNRNKRSNHFLEYNGDKLMITEWAEKLGIKRTSIYNRILLGWDTDRILTTPVRFKTKSKNVKTR